MHSSLEDLTTAPDQDVPHTEIASRPSATARQTKIALPTYVTVPRSQLPPLFDDDNVYPFPLYPHHAFLRNLPQPELQDYNAVIVENDLLRVTVLPSLGGRILQIEDIRTGGCYLHDNRSVRPTRIPPRWNYLSLGIEMSFPYAHSPTGAEPVGYELLEDKESGMAGVAVGETEGQWGLSWRAEIRLYPGFRGVVVAVRCWNSTDVTRDVQWWSNAAQPGNRDVEFVFPNEPFVAHIDGEGIGHWPTFKDVDLRWHRTYDRMVGAFMEPTKSDWFGIYHHEREWGLLHLADPRELPGKKLWSFGSSGQTADWSLTMTRDGDTTVEIQAGIPTLQGDKINFPPGAELAFSEMWVPVDARKELDDGHRLTYAECARRVGGIVPAAKRPLPHDEETVWDQLLKAYNTQDISFLEENAARAVGDWPPTGLPLHDALIWAAQTAGDAWTTALGIWHAAHERWPEAKESFQTALQADPNSAVALACFGLIQWRIDQLPTAAWPLIDLSLSLRQDGSLFVHANNLLRELGRTADRLDLLARWTDDDDFRRTEVHAEILLDSGDTEGGLRMLVETKWPRHHCRHRRTKLWQAAREKLGQPTQPVPEILMEDPYVVSV